MACNKAAAVVWKQQGGGATLWASCGGSWRLDLELPQLNPPSAGGPRCAWVWVSHMLATTRRYWLVAWRWEILHIGNNMRKLHVERG
ncbi:hypothetical protein E2562_038316 [Oryza meyeriana var. granulata]|uniref:Uncharacterized protein n=1 Tax=Oryza meyeriana var. granulata TaxID=110450 RepID=A0A6G1CNI9_9ORYZ|nr:hypothetical protein E2562_038316 [Oryza meyeriana var. granulata]